MKREIPAPVIVAIIAVVLIGIGWFLWRKTDSPGNDESVARARFEKSVEWARQHGIDPKKDPLLAPVYFKYHPEEKPKDGLPSPGGAGMQAPGSAGGPPGGIPTPGQPSTGPPKDAGPH